MKTPVSGSSAAWDAESSGRAVQEKKEVAFLILAHHQPELLARLASRLSADWARLFVHIDRKVDIGPFQAQTRNSNLVFLPYDQRVSAHWCGFSVVAAMLNLMRFALSAAPAANRFVLLSGVDYPIKSMDYIAQVLSRDEEFIQIDRQIDPGGTSLFDRRLNRPYLRDNRFLNERTGRPAAVNLARKLEARIPRRHPDGLKIYYGAQWWSLTRQAVLDILAYLDRNPKVLKWFSLVHIPDESMFHSILKTTSRAEKIAFDATRDGRAMTEENRHALHYIDWTVPNPALPRVLELKDLDAIQRRGAVFARNMALSRSAELLDALDRTCLSVGGS